MEMNIRAPLFLAVLCALAVAAGAPARADAPSASGSNEYSGRQSSSASADTDSSGSAVIDSNITGADVTTSEPAAGDGGTIVVKTTLRHRAKTRPDPSTAETVSVRNVTRTRFQRWSRGWREASTAQIGRPRNAGLAATGEVENAPVAPSAAVDPAPVTTTLAVAEEHTTIRRQADGLTGPPGPVGPSVPDATSPIRVAPEVTAPPAAAPAPATVPQRTAAPAPARAQLPLNGAETARMAKLALLLMAVGFALMAFARRVGVAKPV